MAGNAIVARLQLDSKDYEKKLAEAKKKTRNFSKDGGGDLSAMAGQFKTLAVAVAGSKAAMEVFNRVIASSQTIGDAYTQSIEGAKGAVNEFVYAMANADFSGFNEGLKGIFKNAKEAAQAMDSLGNAQISFDYLTAGYKSAFKTGMGTAKDKSLSMAERRAGYDAAMVALDAMGEAVDVYADKVTAAIVSNAKSKGNNLNADFVTRENIDRIFALDISANGDAEKAALAERYKVYKGLVKQAEKLEGVVNNTVIAAGNQETHERNVLRLAELRSQINSDDMQMAALYNAMLVKGTDEWLKGLADLVIKADNANAQYQELKTSSLEVANALNQPIKQGTVGAALKLTGEQYAKSFGAGYYLNLSNPLARKAAQGVQPIHDVPLIDTTLEAEALPTIKNDVKEVAKDAYTAADGIYAIGGALGSLSSVMGDNASQWINWGATVLSAVGQFASAAASGGGLGLITPAASLLSSFLGVPSLGGGMGGGKVQFKIKGSDLVGSISNYNNIASRSYG